jgi:hypothetical protein
MPTYNLTSKATPGVESNSTSILRSRHLQQPMEKVEAYLDVSKLVAAGVTLATGDVFELLTIPANTLVLAAGAEVMTAFNGTSPTVDIDFAAGDDIVDGGNVATLGYLASGTNGQANVVTTGAASTFAQFVTTTDTIDVLLNFTGTVTTGVLRVYAIIVRLEEFADVVPTEVRRDQRA